MFHSEFIPIFQVLVLECGVWREQCPFFQQFNGGWRKDVARLLVRISVS